MEVSEGRIRSIRTDRGTLLTSPWFVDASGGGASLIARKFNVPSREYGPRKVAMWTYFKVAQQVEGTTLYMDPRPDEYLEWVWEIPVSPDTVSVGYVAPGAAIKAKRDAGRTMEDLFCRQLARFPHFESLLSQSQPGAVNVTSFKCRVYLQSAGRNWLIVGEAAALVDPMTSNGVTAALRHAAEAAELILKFRKRGELPWLAKKTYSSRILQMGKFFNEAIEKIVYEPIVRNHIGLGSAGTAYTSPAWSMNVVYARLKPRGPISTIILDALLGFFRVSASVYYWYCSRRKPSTIPQVTPGALPRS
jgi:flavin-dependent dehydrogenase